MVFSEDSVKKS